MKDLSGPNDPVISRRIALSVTGAILAGMALAYGLYLFAAQMANLILK